MNLDSYFQRLYAYNAWANDQLLAVIEANPPKDERIWVGLSHYLAALEIWISRIEGRAARVNGVWEVYDLGRCKELAAQTAESWNNFLANIQAGDYVRRIAYKNTKGDYYETPVVDIMGHAVNHATYHRAQIATILRQEGIIPVNTDFITYARLHDLGV